MAGAGAVRRAADGRRLLLTVRRVLVALGRQLRALTAHGPIRVLRKLLVSTVTICMRYRVTGLAAEAGFFALLSLPPLVLGLAGSAAWVGSELGADTEAQMRGALRDYVSPFLTENVVNSVILPTFADAIATPRYDLISIGFLLSLWSGSRVLNVYIDTISIMYGLGGRRGIIRTRALSFSLYVVTLLLGALTIPLVLLGPSLLGDWLPDSLQPLIALYWPLSTVLGVVLLATLYHVATPVRASWRRDLPGALLALVIWVLASWALRLVLSSSVGGVSQSAQDTQSFSIYGPLTTPIVVLLWLYMLAIAVLIGAGLNASVERMWPARTLTDGDARRAPEPAVDHPAEGVVDPSVAEAVAAASSPVVPVLHEEAGVPVSTTADAGGKSRASARHDV